MIYQNIKTGEAKEIRETAAFYAVKCDTKKYATHIGEDGNYYCFYGTDSAFDGCSLIKLLKR